jgi:tRNA (guanine37-N1)-methyltransferase
MRIDLLTLFPEVMQPYLSASILGRAQAAGHVEYHLHNLRDYSNDTKHLTVDDRPFGGGAGMVLMCQPVCDAVEAVERQDPREALRLLLTPQGLPFNQGAAQRLATEHERLLLICGHYEGYDERIVEILRPLEISLGDFVLTGGELPALAVVDAVTRLLPGVLGNAEGTADESFQDATLEYPQYTRPRSYRGHDVPEILLSGDHAAIAAWRREQARQRTAQRRPDLLPDDGPAGRRVSFSDQRTLVGGRFAVAPPASQACLVGDAR